MTEYVELPDSTFMDFNSFGSNAPAPSGGTAFASSATFNVALILQRANDPTNLLSSDWATRQTALADQTNIWSLYGANPADYQSAMNFVTTDLGLPVLSGGYVSDNPDTRTIWVPLTVSGFESLFQTSLFQTSAGVVYWANSSGEQANLSLPAELVSAGVTELAFDTGLFDNPVVASQPTTSGVVLSSGSQSPGNATTSRVNDLYPQQIAQDYYNFPLSGAVVSTGVIGVIEPGMGDAPSGSVSFVSALESYRTSAFSGTTITSAVDVQSVASGGQSIVGGDTSERSLDVGIVTTLDPSSTLVLYAGSGDQQNAHSSLFTAYQDAIWDDVYNPQVITNSFRLAVQAAPNSPFRNATLDLLTDAALRNITVFNANGDGGSGDEIGNGVTNVSYARSSPYAVMVGGTSLSTLKAAMNDPTLTSYLSPSPALLWQLVAGGLTSAPGDVADMQRYIETVWNEYVVDTGQNPPFIDGYLGNESGTGGVDPTQPVPWYQQAFGLDPTTTDGRGLTGRGTPDVSADAGGNMHYVVPNPEMDGIAATGGTSAAAPFWAGLATQINAVFADQGLPQLGYMNDLLYIAAVVDPGSFNDITIGNDTSSYELGWSSDTSTNYTASGPDGTSDITPTGYGYSAAPGYDLVTGLGTPNGLLLARALTQIAHSEVSFSSVPDVVDSDNAGGWQAGTDQSLLFQTMAGTGTSISLDLGGDTTSFSNQSSQPYAWTSRMAQQSLQSGFDPNLVTMFDGESQGTLVQAAVGSGDSIAVNINAAATQATQATLSQAFGFADFLSSDGSSAVRVAQPVAVAETAGGADNQEAIARIRQNGMSSNLSLEFYRVEDYEGTVVYDGVSLHPGDPGYEQAADANAYQLSTGGTTIAGPGYGQYAETDLQGVNAGDLVAMLLRNASSTFFAFAPANESVNGQNVSHLWNYGANTWGWEDAWGGGDRDYNDVVVQLDFTSKSGSGLLVGSGGSTG